MSTKQIYKYAGVCNLGEITQIKIPDMPIVHTKIEKFESFGFQRIVLWVETEDCGKTVCERRFQVFATGEEIPKKSEHICTSVQTPFVWHLYELFD